VAGEGLTWELESKMLKSYPELLTEVHFRGRKFLKLGRIVTPVRII
jgi:hypothetical protein